MNPPNSSSSADNYFTEKKIAIIGAGMAGLSAAVRFKELGFQNIHLLEARDYLGGRIKSVHFDSNFIEMGAQWIHGQKGNCIYEIAEKYDLLDIDASDYMESICDWDNLLNSDYKENILKTAGFLEDAVEEIESSKDSMPDFEGNLSSNLHEVFENYLQHSKDTSPNCVAEKACYDWFVKLQCEINGCNSLNDVSRNLFCKYQTCEGCQVVELKYGYSAVLNILIKSLPSVWIAQNQKVTTICWNHDPGVESLAKKDNAVTFQSDGDQCKRFPVTIYCDDGLIYNVDHVIVTVPLGCLKATAHQLLFVPELPSKKLKAIESLGFGVVDKIYLEYQEPFWEGPAIFNMLWFNDSFQSTSENSTCQKDMVNIWFKYISRFAYVPHHPKMLCAWIVGEGAIFMEKLPESQVIFECNKLLKEQLQRSDLPYPCKMIRSKWGSDPYSYGSYSYNSIACDKAETSHEDLAEPILVEINNSMYPILLFAGEATHPSYFSTVHGAYETGIREANRIFEYYQ